jgi:hypothetical protein
MTAAFCTLALCAQAMVGHWGHHGQAAAADACCTTCGAMSAELAGLIQQLQTDPNWKDRKAAARELRQYDWKCHPEAAQALAAALLCDCDDAVRRQSAHSLKVMKPCLPGVHEALARAAACDRLLTRIWARCGLKAIGKRCTGACAICGPAPTAAGQVVVEEPGGAPIPVEVIEPPLEPVPVSPPLAPPAGTIEPPPAEPAPAEMPPVPPAASPFAPRPMARRQPDAERPAPASHRRPLLTRLPFGRRPQ